MKISILLALISFVLFQTVLDAIYLNSLNSTEIESHCIHLDELKFKGVLWYKYLFASSIFIGRETIRYIDNRAKKYVN